MHSMHLSRYGSSQGPVTRGALQLAVGWSQCFHELLVFAEPLVLTDCRYRIARRATTCIEMGLGWGGFRPVVPTDEGEF